MKIAMLGHKRIPSREGGVEIVVQELAVRMAEYGHDLVVYNRMGKHIAGADKATEDLSKVCLHKGVRIKSVWTLPNKSLNAIVYSFLATVCAVFSGADVIHFHAEGPCSMIPIAKVFKKKCVATIHGLDWKRAKWGGFATRFLLFGEKMAAKYADEVIVLSKDVQEYFKKTYGRNVKMIPNGVNEPECKRADIITDKYGLAGNDYLLFLARLVPEKGVHTLLEAYRKSKVKYPLVIAGGSSHSDDYIQKINLMANEINDGKECPDSCRKVIFTGFVQGTELQELYSNAFLYILPSEIEGLPLSLLEAMSYGKICLTSDIPENTDVLDKYGYSFRVGDSEHLADMLTEICCSNDKLCEEGTWCPADIQRYVLNKYNWDEVVKRTMECYENIIGQ